MKTCLCGCGTPVKSKYVLGHHLRVHLHYTEDGLKICPTCNQAKPPTTEYWQKSTRVSDGWLTYCKICRNKTNAEWAKANPEKIRKKDREWKRKQRREHPEKDLAIKRKWQLKLRTELINAYGNKCACCGETILEFLTLEHVNGDGKEHRKRVGSGSKIWLDLKRRGWPQEGFTLLCWNCHMATCRGLICPHKRTP